MNVRIEIPDDLADDLVSVLRAGARTHGRPELRELAWIIQLRVAATRRKPAEESFDTSNQAGRMSAGSLQEEGAGAR